MRSDICGTPLIGVPDEATGANVLRGWDSAGSSYGDDVRGEHLVPSPI
jgi:hypothetical protein